MAKKNLKPSIREIGSTGNRKSNRAKIAYKWVENLDTAGIESGRQYKKAVNLLRKREKKLK